MIPHDEAVRAVETYGDAREEIGFSRGIAVAEMIAAWISGNASRHELMEWAEAEIRKAREDRKP